MPFSQYIAVIGAGAARFADSLARYFSNVVLLPPAPMLAPPVASHPDMLLARIGGRIIVAAQYADIAETALSVLAAHVPVRCADTPLFPDYPRDVAYNVFVHAGRLYGRTDTLAVEILAAAKEAGLPVRSVRQGYAGCSSLSCKNGVLTADPSMISALTAEGVEVLSLTPGGISLPGYDTGFIGGASGFCENTAIFFGDPATHPDGDRIRLFLEMHEIEVLTLGNGCLTDFGGIVCIPLKRPA